MTNHPTPDLQNYNSATDDLIAEVRSIRTAFGLRIVEIQAQIIAVIRKLLIAEGDHLPDVLNTARIPLEGGIYTVENAVRSLIRFMSEEAMSAPMMTAIVGVTLLAHREQVEPDKLVPWLKEGGGVYPLYLARVANHRSEPPEPKPETVKPETVKPETVKPETVKPKPQPPPGSEPPALRGEAPQPKSSWDRDYPFPTRVVTLSITQDDDRDLLIYGVECFVNEMRARRALDDELENMWCEPPTSMPPFRQGDPDWAIAELKANGIADLTYTLELDSNPYDFFPPDECLAVNSRGNVYGVDEDDADAERRKPGVIRVWWPGDEDWYPVEEEEPSIETVIAYWWSYLDSFCGGGDLQSDAPEASAESFERFRDHYRDLEKQFTQSERRGLGGDGVGSPNSAPAMEAPEL